MGVQAIRTITGKKEDTVLTTPATALAAFPAAGEVSVVTILAVADQHRLADAERAIRICLDYARDNNLYTSAVSVSVVTTLNGGKAGVVELLLAAEVVTGHVGIMIVGAVRDLGQRQFIENTHIQTLEFMREQNRLVV